VLGHQFHIPEKSDNAIEVWLRSRIQAISLCLKSGLPEDALTLIYSGIDTLGFLDAPLGQLWATEVSFEAWSDRYIVPSLRPVVGTSPSAVDLFGARCGILHTSTSFSQLGKKGAAREIWYQYRGKSAVNLTLDTPGMPLLIDIDQFANVFEVGGARFVADLKMEKVRFDRAEARAARFFSWGVRSSPASSA
jgi:hypothetical protein